MFKGYITCYEKIIDKIRDALKHHGFRVLDGECVLCGESI